MAFDQEHRGDRAHAHFMRSFCQRISAPVPEPMLSRRDTALSTPAIVEEAPSEGSTADGGEAPPASPKPPGSPRPGDKTPKSESKKKRKGAQIAERHPKPHKRGNGPPGNPPAPKSTKSWPRLSPASTFEAPKLSPSNGKILLFVSYPHQFPSPQLTADVCWTRRFLSSTTRPTFAVRRWRLPSGTPGAGGP